jgi:hypothetical protein
MFAAVQIDVIQTPAPKCQLISLPWQILNKQSTSDTVFSQMDPKKIWNILDMEKLSEHFHKTVTVNKLGKRGLSKNRPDLDSTAGKRSRVSRPTVNPSVLHADRQRNIGIALRTRCDDFFVCSQDLNVRGIY